MSRDSLTSPPAQPTFFFHIPSTESAMDDLPPADFGGVLLNHHRIALLTDGYSTPFLAKTGISLLRYRGDDVVAVIDREMAGKTSQEILHAGHDTPVVADLHGAGIVDAVYVGIAPPGGRLPVEWRPLLIEALQNGIDVVSGLHDFLIDDEEFVRIARSTGAQLLDVRRNRHRETAVRHAFRSGNLRIHTVGHDCSVGKMVTTLELQAALQDAGHDAKFVATGQTGIMIAGAGVPIDCVVADFVNGAAEQLCVQHEQHEITLIEGQGSISHPAFSAVTLGLLHGCAPDGLIFCYEAGRDLVKGLDDVSIPAMEDQIAAYRTLANLRHRCRFIGIAVNTRTLTPDQAEAEIERVENHFGLPACDVYRSGPDKLVQATLELQQEIGR